MKTVGPRAVPSAEPRNWEKRRMAGGIPRKHRQRLAVPATGGAAIGQEVELCAMADVLGGSMDAGEYKHAVLGLMLSDGVEEQRDTWRQRGSLVPAGTRHWDAAGPLVRPSPLAVRRLRGVLQKTGRPPAAGGPHR